MNSTEAELVTKSGLLCKEKARDVELVVQLEEWTDTTILQRSEEMRISLWVKVNTYFRVDIYRNTCLYPYSSL